MSAEVERTSRLVSIEHVDHVEAEVFLQPLDIGVGAMENLRGQKRLFRIKDKAHVTESPAVSKRKLLSSLCVLLVAISVLCDSGDV